MYAILNIWPTTVEGWVLLGTAVLGFLGALIKLIQVSLKLKKTAVKLKDALKELVKRRDFDALMKIVKKVAIEAEKTKLVGAGKKEMVFSAIKAACLESQIEIDDATLNEVSENIDELISFYNDMREATNIAKGVK